MKRPIWLVANEIFSGRPGEKLPEVIRENNIEIIDFKLSGIDYIPDNYRSTTRDEVIIPHGPKQFVRQI